MDASVLFLRPHWNNNSSQLLNLMADCRQGASIRELFVVWASLETWRVLPLPLCTIAITKTWLQFIIGGENASSYSSQNNAQREPTWCSVEVKDASSPIVFLMRKGSQQIALLSGATEDSWGWRVTAFFTPKHLGVKSPLTRCPLTLQLYKESLPGWCEQNKRLPFLMRCGEVSLLLSLFNLFRRGLLMTRGWI